MKKVAWLITAASLVLAGCILFGGMMMALGWDFTKFSTVKYETNTHEITEQVSRIQIETKTANTVFLPADEDVCKVVCCEAENKQHSVYVEDGCLKVQYVNEKKWYEYIGLHFETSKITVYLPREVYESLCIDIDTGHVNIPSDFQFGTVDISGHTGDISVGASASERMCITTSTGDITVSDTTAGSMELKVSTGKIVISNVACLGDVKLQVSTGKSVVTDLTCRNFSTSGNTGDLSLDQVVAAEKITIQRTTGDIQFTACDAANFFVKTDTGDVSGTLLSDKVFVYETSTGRVDLPKTVTGGKFEVITSTGDIRLKIVD